MNLFCCLENREEINGREENREKNSIWLELWGEIILGGIYLFSTWATNFFFSKLERKLE